MCGRRLTVIPGELLLLVGDSGSPIIRAAPDDAIRGDPYNTFRCPCGATGWLGLGYVRAPTSAREVSATQRVLLGALLGGERDRDQLRDVLDFDDIATWAEVGLAFDRGWIETRPLGLGGLVKPHVIWALTDAGREVLGSDSA